MSSESTVPVESAEAAMREQWGRTHDIRIPNRPLIPDAAIEAAARVMKGSGWIDDIARTLLEAAAPHMLREAWQTGYDIGCDRTIDAAPNPYGEP